MSRGERVMIHAANGLVSITGAVYAAMRYLLQPAEEWAVVNHPWQPHVQHLHVLSAPLLVFAVGLLWSRHVIGKLRVDSDGQRSGIGLLVAFVPMAASGSLIQVAVEPAWRTAWVGVHLVSSGVWLAAFAVHQVRIMLSRASDLEDVSLNESQEVG